MGNSLLLLASANGLGHARRLFHLHHEFLRQSIESELIVNSYQFNKCKSEFPKTTLDKVFISNSKFGLDGPHAIFRDREELDVTSIRICNAENIVSDNLIWPASYNPNVFVHGHFTWVDYWNKLLDSTIISPPAELGFEISLNKEVRAWFATESFRFPQSFLNDAYVPMPLIAYPNDRDYKLYKRNWKEIWVSIGTTNDEIFLNFDLVLESLERLGFEIRRHETYLFHDLQVLPGLVIGRPGLGTIRDCLASGTAFLTPIDGTHNKLSDPELSNNLEVLSVLGLLPSLESINVRELQQFSEIYRAFWVANSSPISDYSNRILQVISEMRR